MPALRKDAVTKLLSIAVLSALLGAPVVMGQATAPASAPALPGVGGYSVGGYSGTTTISEGSLNLSSSATAPAASQPAIPGMETPANVAAFVGTVTGDKVYIRSGPGAAYYEMGQLTKGDLVQVVGSKSGWYQILPPNGAFGMIAKEFVQADASGTAGTVMKDYVNLRAGTALYRTREPSAVLTVVRKGTRLPILGSTDKYYQVAPTENAFVYISPNFVARAGAGTEYRIPTLKLPPGATGPARDTVTSVPQVLPTAGGVDITPAPTGPGQGVATGMPGDVTPPATGGTEPTTVDRTVVPPPQPATTFNPTAAAKLREIDEAYQAELKKAVGSREFEPLIKQYKDLLALENLPPSVKITAEARVEALEKIATIQKLQRESTASADQLAEQRKALQQQYSAAEDAIKAYQESGPYVAQGVLQTSQAVPGKYALVNPTTGRTVAYVDPNSEVDIGSLVGKYIGVRGTSHMAEGTQVEVITVKNATLQPMPDLPKAPSPKR